MVMITTNKIKTRMENLEQFKHINDAISKAAAFDKIVIAYKKWEKENNTRGLRDLSSQLLDLNITGDSWASIIYNALTNKTK